MVPRYQWWGSLFRETRGERIRESCVPLVFPELPRECSTAAGKQLQLVPTMNPELQRVLQAMSPAQKLRAAERLYWSARQLKAAALRAEHPDWTEEAIQQAVRQIFLYARS